jgi:hypothetical protein
VQLLEVTCLIFLKVLEVPHKVGSRLLQAGTTIRFFS